MLAVHSDMSLQWCCPEGGEKSKHYTCIFLFKKNLSNIDTFFIYISLKMTNEILQNIPTLNSLAPGRPRCHFKTAIFNLVLLIGISTSSKDNALRWMPRDLTDDKSTLDQVMAWRRQATSHYLSQFWPSSMSPYGVTRPQWVNSHEIFQANQALNPLKLNVITFAQI